MILYLPGMEWGVVCGNLKIQPLSRCQNRNESVQNTAGCLGLQIFNFFSPGLIIVIINDMVLKLIDHQR